MVYFSINSVREISARCPLALDDDLLHDLVTYKTHKDKGVNMAARSLIQLYRVNDPTRLQRKHRVSQETVAGILSILSFSKTYLVFPLLYLLASIGGDF